MERGDGNKALLYGVEIGAILVLEAEVAGADPVVFLASRIEFFDHQVAVDPSALPRDPHAPNFLTRTCRHVDVEKGIGRQSALGQSCSHQGGEPCGGGEIGRRTAFGFERDGEGGDPHQGRLHGGGDGAGIGNVVAHVAADVDPGDYKVRTPVEQTVNAKVNAIGRRSVDGVMTGGHLGGPQGAVQGQGMTGGAAFPVGSYDHDVAERSQVFGQSRQARRKDAIVVGYQNQHCGPR